MEDSRDPAVLAAFLCPLVVRLLSRALLSFATHFLSELYAQVVFGAAEVEQQVVEWLQWQLGWPSASPPPTYLTSGAPATQPGPWMLLLLGLHLPPAGGGWGTHEAQEKFQGLFRDAPEYFLMLRLSFFALPAFFAVLMLAYHYGIPELCLF